jgi:hypothetical protein
LKWKIFRAYRVTRAVPWLKLKTDMTDASFNRTTLTFAPLTLPASALSGGTIGALSGGSFALLTEPGLIALLVAFALVGGVPIGLLFWAMKDTSESIRIAIVAIFVFVCVLAFFALFIPLNGIANI